MSHRVRLTRKAALDVALGFNWLIENRPEGAAFDWRDKLAAALLELETKAASCPEAIEAERLGAEIREFDFGRRSNTYRILFRLRDEWVEVLRVRHARQEVLGPEEI